jgi:hypothetical protein
MTDSGKLHFVHQVLDLLLIIIVVIYVIPAAKNTLFPTQMTRIENMLRNSTLKGYHIAVDRKDDLEFILTVFDGGKSITAQIYRDVLRELDPVEGRRVFISHAINRNADKAFYISNVRLETDSDLKHLRRLEISVCDRIKDQSGKVEYDNDKPIYECEVPIKRITASAVKK